MDRFLPPLSAATATRWVVVVLSACGVLFAVIAFCRFFDLGTNIGILCASIVAFVLARMVHVKSRGATENH